MHDKEEELIYLGFKEYDSDAIREMSCKVLKDFIEECGCFTDIAILNLSCRCHLEYKVYYRILH